MAPTDYEALLHMALSSIGLGYLALIQKREVRVPPRVTKEKQKFLCKTNVRFADLKALETPYE